MQFTQNKTKLKSKSNKNKKGRVNMPCIPTKDPEVQGNQHAHHRGEPSQHTGVPSLT